MFDSSYIETQQQVIITDFMSIMKPRPRLSVSEWAELYRYVAPPSAETGPWRNDRTPYLKGIMDAAVDPDVHTIVVMTASQIGKSEALNNIMYYFMHQDPCPIMMIQPTLTDADDYSKSRITPTIKASPELAKLFGDELGKTRNSVNTILSKHFPGGRLIMVGANSPSGLASRAIRVVAADEIGRYEATKEGDPVELARQRQATFYNALLVLTSTPGTRGTCPIDFWYNMSDKRNFFVPCAGCGEYMTLKWRDKNGIYRVVWDKDEETGEHLPETARYCCEHCGVLLNDYDINEMVKRGEWRATAPFDGIAGFGDFPDLYSPWRKMENTVRDFLRSKDDTELYKVFVNTKLGLPWEDDNEHIDSNEIFDRREPYDLMCPAEAGLITAAVDVQDNRLEVLTCAWGRDEQCWALEHQIFMGSPGVVFKDLDDAGQAALFEQDPQKAPGVWNHLDLFLQKRYDHPSGLTLPISICVIDSGGHFTDQVYMYVKPRQRKGIKAIKGAAQRGKPIVSPPSRSNKRKVALYNIGVFAAKEVVMSRLKIGTPDRPGYIHFPDRFSTEFFEQLTAEKKVTLKRRGRPIQEWQLTRARNEGFDLMVYNLAALRIKCGTREVLNRYVEKIAGLAKNNVGTTTVDNTPKQKKRRVLSQGVKI